MSNAPLQHLLSPLHQSQGRCLWVADENSHADLPLLAPFAERLTLITHRCDTHLQAQRLGLTSVLTDAHWPSGDFNACFFRIAKEKPLVHHLINQARQQLPAGGRLWLAGYKNEGIKTYCEKAAVLFQQKLKPQKQGDFYLCGLTQPASAGGDFLPTQDYSQLRPVFQLNGQAVYSKPGIYGWDKIDKGSELLIHSLRQTLPPTAIARCLDLGCGYGYLSLALADYPIHLRVATDNNLAAVAAMQANAQAWGLNLTATTADCAEGIDEQFELIVCNPPFHKGFDTQGDLTDLFLSRAKQRLSPNGQAWFVVNSFIPIETKAKRLFKRGEVLSHTPQFKVLRCWH